MMIVTMTLLISNNSWLLIFCPLETDAREMFFSINSFILSLSLTIFQKQVISGGKQCDQIGQFIGLSATF